MSLGLALANFDMCITYTLIWLLFPTGHQRWLQAKLTMPRSHTKTIVYDCFRNRAEFWQLAVIWVIQVNFAPSCQKPVTPACTRETTRKISKPWLTVAWSGMADTETQIRYRLSWTVFNHTRKTLLHSASHGWKGFKISIYNLRGCVQKRYRNLCSSVALVGNAFCCHQF